MKKSMLIAILFLGLGFSLLAQLKTNDFGRIILNTYLPANTNLPAEARELLETKLTEIAAINGIGGSQANPRFIITAKVNVETKDIVAGPPQLIAQILAIRIYVGDAINNTIFSSTTIKLKATGTNENKAYINAFRSINCQSKELSECLDIAKNKIIAYYTAQCDLLSKEARTLVGKQQFDEAIYKLALIPEVCADCYTSSQATIKWVYQQKIDYEGAAKLTQAKTAWMNNQNSEGARAASDLLNEINPQAACYNQISPLVKAIAQKIMADEKREWQFQMKQYADNLVMEKNRINAYRDIAVEYAKHQPQVVVYNRIIWW